jgi:hypothetical protein
MVRESVGRRLALTPDWTTAKRRKSEPQQTSIVFGRFFLDIEE